jgi:hypothetical protein
MARKLGGLAMIAFAVFFVISNPHAAAGFIHQIASGIGAFATDLAHGGH